MASGNIPEEFQVLFRLQQQAVVGRNRFDDHRRDVVRIVGDRHPSARLSFSGTTMVSLATASGIPGRGRDAERKVHYRL